MSETQPSEKFEFVDISKFTELKAERNGGLIGGVFRNPEMWMNNKGEVIFTIGEVTDFEVQNGIVGPDQPMQLSTSSVHLYDFTNNEFSLSGKDKIDEKDLTQVENTLKRAILSEYKKIKKSE